MADPHTTGGTDDTEIDELLTAMVGRARAEVPATDSAQVVAAARAARDSGLATRRKKLSGSIGVAAALLLIAVGVVALVNRDQPTTTLAASTNKAVGSETDANSGVAANAVTALLVTPHTGLVDRQEVTVVVPGFDAGSEVTAMQCAIVAEGYACPLPGGNEPLMIPAGTADTTGAQDTSDAPDTPDTPDGIASADAPDTAVASDSPDAPVTAVAPDIAVAPDTMGVPGTEHTVTTTLRVSATLEDLALYDPPGELAHEGVAPERADCTLDAQLEPSSPTRIAPARPAPSGMSGVMPTIAPGEPDLPDHALIGPSAPVDAAPSQTEPGSPGIDQDAEPPAPTVPDPDGSTSNARNTAAPCGIVAMGFRGGVPAVDVAPIWFATPGDTEPGTPPGDTEPGTPPAPSSPAPPGEVPPANTAPDGSGGSTTPDPPAPTHDPRCPAPSSAGWPDTQQAGPMLEFNPTSVIVCRYGVRDATTATEITDTATLTRLTRDLEALPDTVTDELACTMEMGPSMTLLASNGRQNATIRVEFYGCRFVANGDRVRLGADGLLWLWDATD